MDTTYRFRFLLYFAAFMLVMSLCFVYAEPVPAAIPAQQPLLFQVTPQHSGFLVPSTMAPSFDPAALRAASAPAVTPQMLQQLEEATHGRHGLFHRSRHAAVRHAPASSQDLSSVLGPLLGASPTAAAR